MKYVLFVPKGGFNDILCGLGKSIDYCKKYNRTLLFVMKLSYSKGGFIRLLRDSFDNKSWL
jgi:hypothetical protein